MKSGICYLSENQWRRISEKEFVDCQLRREDVSQLCNEALYRLTPPDPESLEGDSVRLQNEESDLYIVQKDDERKPFAWGKIKYKPYSCLAGLPFSLAPFSKENFFERIPNYILSTQWKANGSISSILLKPKENRVYFYLDAGELGTVKIEKITAESVVAGNPPVVFEYPLASVEPSSSSSRFLPYYCQRISVDGVPCELMSWEEIKAVARKVRERALSLVILQGWRGTELLFQSAAPRCTREKEALVEEKSISVDYRPAQIRLQIVESVYDSHPFLHASFADEGKWWPIEQICVSHLLNLGNSSSQSLQRIEELWKKNEISIFLYSLRKAPSLLIQPVEQKRLYFFFREDPASRRRYLHLESTSTEGAGEVELESFPLRASSSPKYASAKKKPQPKDEGSDVDSPKEGAQGWA